MPAPTATEAPRTGVAIRGAGPVGCALALALRGCSHPVSLVDAGAPPAGFRPIALSHASRLILERLGVWQELAATPIEQVHVSQAGAFGQTRLDANEAGVPALGYVVDYSSLAILLRSRAAGSATATLEDPGVMIHAEGFSTQAREKRYAQDAVVGVVTLDRPSRGTAYERFTPHGPVALLPTDGRYALIWTVPPERAAALVSLPQADFLRELSQAIGPRIGRATAVEARSAQPLVLRVRGTRTAPRTVYIGNAAQTLHPVAGQGLNLGLRDAWDLAQFLRNVPDPGAGDVLARYAATRRFDALATIFVTDFLAGTGALARMQRSAALVALEALPPARKFFARRMIFGPSALP